VRRVREQIFKNQGYRGSPWTSGGYRKEENSQQGQRDPDRADQQIFPRRFKRTMMPVEVNEWSTGQGCSLDSYPKKSYCWLRVTRVIAERNRRRQHAKLASRAFENRNPSSKSECDSPRSPRR